MLTRIAIHQDSCYIDMQEKRNEASGPHGMFDYDKTITRYELDYRLKEKLRALPENRYQHEKNITISMSYALKVETNARRQMQSTYNHFLVEKHTSQNLILRS